MSELLLREREREKGEEREGEEGDQDNNDIFRKLLLFTCDESSSGLCQV